MKHIVTYIKWCILKHFSPNWVTFLTLSLWARKREGVLHLTCQLLKCILSIVLLSELHFLLWVSELHQPEQRHGRTSIPRQCAALPWLSSQFHMSGYCLFLSHRKWQMPTMKGSSCYKQFHSLHWSIFTN